MRVGIAVARVAHIAILLSTLALLVMQAIALPANAQGVGDVLLPRHSAIKPSMVMEDLDWWDSKIDQSKLGRRYETDDPELDAVLYRAGQVHTAGVVLDSLVAQCGSLLALIVAGGTPGDSTQESLEPSSYLDRLGSTGKHFGALWNISRPIAQATPSELAAQAADIPHSRNFRGLTAIVRRARAEAAVAAAQVQISRDIGHLVSLWGKYSAFVSGVARAQEAGFRLDSVLIPGLSPIEVSGAGEGPASGGAPSNSGGGSIPPTSQSDSGGGGGSAPQSDPSPVSFVPSIRMAPQNIKNHARVALSCLVVDPNGTPIVGADVEFALQVGQANRARALGVSQTDQDGRAVYETLVQFDTRHFKHFFVVVRVLPNKQGGIEEVSERAELYVQEN